MTACSWWNVGFGLVNVVCFAGNVWLGRLFWRLIRNVVDTYVPGAEVLKHLDSDKKE